MQARHGLLAAIGALVLIASLAWLLRGQGGTEGGQLLPEFGATRAGVTQLSLLGAGRTTLLTFEKTQGHWTLRERGGWHADEARVEQLLDELAQARIVEGKTRKPDRYPRIGVEDIAAVDATGVAWSWLAAGQRHELIVGDPGPGQQGRHVRLSSEAQALLVDRALATDRDPLAWLDHRLLDVPMPRIREASVQPRSGTAFRVLAGSDGFSVADVPLASSDSDVCADLAGFLDRLVFEDVASADHLPVASALAADIRVDFLSVNGMVVSVQAWRNEARYWIEMSVRLDEETARAWLATSAPGATEEAVTALRSEIDALQLRLKGRRFLLSIDKAAVLVKTRPQYVLAP